MTENKKSRTRIESDNRSNSRRVHNSLLEMQHRWSGLRKWVIFPVTGMSFRWWTRGPNKTIFSVARVNDAIQPRVPWQRARHLPLGHIFRRGVTPCLITQPGWLSPVVSTITHVCNTLSFRVRVRECVHDCQTERFLKHHLQDLYCTTTGREKKRPTYLFSHKKTTHAHANHQIKESASYFLNTLALIAFICCEKLISGERKCKCAWITY